MEIKKDERPDVLLPKKPNAVFNHPMGFPLYDGLAMDMHAMRFAEALLKDNDELRAALVEQSANQINAELLAALKVIVEAGGIGPEEMFRDARDAITRAEGGAA
jgi:hypothetical protein